MPLPAVLLILATLFPLAACVTLLFLGKRFGTPLAGYVATAFITLSFLCSGWGMLRWIAGGTYQGQPFGKEAVAPIGMGWRWVPVGAASHPNGFDQDRPGFLDIGLYLDSLTFGLFLTITFAAMMVHIFAIRSLRRDPRFSRFFVCLSLSCFATLAMLLGGSFLQMAVFLEMVGFASALLIGFRSDRESAVRSAEWMFVVSRVGDVGLCVGLGLLVVYLGNLQIPDVWMLLRGAGHGGPIVLPDKSLMPTGVVTAAGVALFLGAAARCAQFPLQVWAARAAEAIAPAAGTVLAVTLLPAGLVFIARLFPILTPSARLLVAIIGATTAVMAALISAVQTDVKKTLALVAVSQLGCMVLGMGVGSWVGALYHLVACAFFLVLLFLAAGAVIRAARGQSDLLAYGGLFGRMPVTAITSAVAALAVCGVGWGDIGLSGYYSRQLILRHSAAFASLETAKGRSGAIWALFAMQVVANLIVSFSMTRWWMLTFAGHSRDKRLSDHAREVSTLYWPLVILAIMTALAGNWLGVRDVLESSIFEARQAVQSESESRANQPPRARLFDAAWMSDPRPEDDPHRDEAFAGRGPAELVRADALARRWGWPGFALGILAATLLYLRGDRTAARIRRIPPACWIHSWLYNRMYFDDLYETLVVNVVTALSEAALWIDQNVFDAAGNLICRPMLGVLGILTRRRSRRPADAPVNISDAA